MNFSSFHLVEPYNAYTSQNPKKKHWHQIVEEEALMHRIISEQMALLAEAANGDASSAAAAAAAAGASGGGGVPVIPFFQPQAYDIRNFTASAQTGSGPFSVKFINLSPIPQFNTYLWTFGDGTTSNEVSPIHVYQTGSLSYTASLQITNSVGNASSSIVIKNGYISASKPVVTSSFTIVTSSNFGPSIATFTNTSINSSQTPTSSYLWIFGNGSSSFNESQTPMTYSMTGSVTASLQITGSYGLSSSVSSMFFLGTPSITASFTIITSSNFAPSITTFVNTTQHTGSGALIYLWTYNNTGTASFFTSTASTAPPFTYISPGPYTASLQVTESAFPNIKSVASVQWSLS